MKNQSSNLSNTEQHQLVLNELVYRYNLSLEVWSLSPLFWPKFCLDHSYPVSSWVYLEMSLMALRRHWCLLRSFLARQLFSSSGEQDSVRSSLPWTLFLAPIPALPAPSFFLCHNFTSRSDFTNISLEPSLTSCCLVSKCPSKGHVFASSLWQYPEMVETLVNESKVNEGTIGVSPFLPCCWLPGCMQWAALVYDLLPPWWA